MGYDRVGRISDPLEPVRQELNRIHGLVKEASLPEGTRVAQVVRNIGAQVREIEEVSELNTISINELAAQESLSISPPDRQFNIGSTNRVNWSIGFDFTPNSLGIRDTVLSGRIRAPYPGISGVEYHQSVLFLSEGGRVIVSPDSFVLFSAPSEPPSGSIAFSIPLRLEGGATHEFQIAGTIFGPPGATVRLEEIVFSLRVSGEV